MREIFDRHGCLKGKMHGYERVYEPAFKRIRHERLRILEIGIFLGASIASWVDYFPHANIVCIDTFQRVPPGKVPILNHRRVQWHKHDSTIPINLGRFDYVIDDGCHTHRAQRATFENFMQYVDRAYFIEDVWPMDRLTEKQKRHKGFQKDGYSDAEYAALLEALEPYETKFHDLRRGYDPASFIIEVRPQ
jgi:hypothetical protein